MTTPKLPTNWRATTLGEIALQKPNNGIFRKNPDYLANGSGGLPVVWVKELFSGNSIDTKESRRLAPTRVEVEKYGLKKGDILFCRSSLKMDGIAFNNVYLGEDNAALFECHLIRISPKQEEVSPVFLNWMLRSPQMRAVAKSKSNTATMTTIDQPSLASIQIPLPSLAEQKRIAGILDAADALRAKRRESLAQLDTLLQSTFLDMFGDGKQNPNRWPVSLIGNLIADMRGGASLKPDDFTTTGFPVLHKGAIKPRGVVELDAGKKTYVRIEYAESKRRSIVTKEFTVVTLRDLVPSGPSIGLAAYLGNAPFTEYLLAQGAYGFRLDQTKIMPDYFVALSNDVGFRTVFKRFSVGSTQIHIRNPIYLKIKVPVPPLDLQQRFAAIVESVEQQKAIQRAHLAELDTLFASLQSRAFRGDL